jgi:hypothetical protein
MDTLEKLFLSVVIVVLAIPGLVIEPGPISEIIALSLLVGVWTGEDDVGASDVTEAAGGGV